MPLPAAFSLKGNKHNASSKKFSNMPSQSIQRFKIIFYSTGKYEPFTIEERFYRHN
jgi:hypothetical protein